jgi:hypothetical protein
MSPALRCLASAQTTGHRRPARLAVAALLGAIALAIRLIPLAFGIESTDIRLYRQQAIPVVQIENVYEVTRNVFPYTPVSLFYPALCLGLSALLDVPFHIVVKLFAIGADVGIVLMLYALGAKLLPAATALSAALAYALNPASILVSAFHGNAMSFVVLLMLAASMLFMLDPARHLVSSGLLLSLAVGWRSFPILLLPFFLAAIRSTADKVRFAACVVVPVVLATIPFMLVSPSALLSEVLRYSGWGIHHGPLGVVRALYLSAIGQVTWEHPPEWLAWMSASKALFLVVYGVAVWRAGRLGLLNGTVVTFFAFYLVYAGVASQYLIWVMPFLLLAGQRAMYWSYVLAATYALVVFYWTFFPDILFGTIRTAGAPVAQLLSHYAISQALLSIVCVVGLVMFGKGIATAPAVDWGAEAPGPPTSRAALGVVGRLVGVYYLLLIVWELAFVSLLR